MVAALFLLVIAAGLYGTPVPERNLATTLTWSLWWAGLIVSIFFLGSAWCGICPWDSLAQWLVRRRLWRRGRADRSLNLRFPAALQSVWPALALFVGLTWLELGVGITRSPYATAGVALLMVVLATGSLALFERKAFCRYLCPVGRTVGFYSQLAPVALRPARAEVCAECQTLECYHGTSEVEPCPTRLVMGRLTENTYCTSCGSCVRSCPHHNVRWTARLPGAEAWQQARPHGDEGWFMLVLLALTTFHGLTMMPFWEVWMAQLARLLGDSGQLLRSFSLGMLGTIGITVVLFASAVWGSARLLRGSLPYARLFPRLAFTALPLAFAYHLAHNLNHLVREGAGLGAVWLNPFGRDTLPPGMEELHLRHMNPLLSESWLAALQAGLMVFGFFLAVQVLRHRAPELYRATAVLPGWRAAPMLAFAAGVSGFDLWLLMQPMTMRL
jgi:ferredoxin